MKRELTSYFISPVAYIVTGLFLIFSGFLFFSTFFIQGRAELRHLFSLLPVLLSFFIPALTMKSFAEENRSGSIETLMTLPVTEFQVVLGKFLAAFIASAVMIAPTLFYVVTAYIFGSPEAGPIIGGYIGALFLCAAFSAIGLFASSVTKNQIIAFFIAFAICMLLSTLSSFLVLFPGVLVNILSYFTADSHFDSIARGIIDTRDILYFVSLTIFFFALCVKTEQNARR
jgi:ABC-2 type transport system permease protein